MSQYYTKKQLNNLLENLINQEFYIKAEQDENNTN
ncbi:hypothetical protein BH23PAT2_BH23PAT2_08380 [soil metagenome]